MREAVLFILGYSFSDEHINEIIFQGMRSNSRLAVAALVYGDKIEARGSEELVLPDKLISFGKTNRNLSIYGPDKAVIGGIVGEWEVTTKKSDVDLSSFWNNDEKSACAAASSGIPRAVSKTKILAIAAFLAIAGFNLSLASFNP